MGFFSWNCKECGHPLISHWRTNKVNKWMRDAVVITQRGSIIKGEYDGYGRLDGVDITLDLVWNKHGRAINNPACYHKACWEKAGRPDKYGKGSKMSADQGYFFDEGEHDMEEPK